MRLVKNWSTLYSYFIWQSSHDCRYDSHVNVGSISAYRLRRWSNLKPTLVRRLRLVYTGWISILIISLTWSCGFRQRDKTWSEWKFQLKNFNKLAFYFIISSNDSTLNWRLNILILTGSDIFSEIIVRSINKICKVIIHCVTGPVRNYTIIIVYYDNIL